MTRRTVLGGSVGLAAGLVSAAPFLLPRYDRVRKPARSRVAILYADSYSEGLAQNLWKSLQLFRLDLRGKASLLKPNLVEYIPGNHVNTHPLLVAAAAECFMRLGARSVVVAEGPGHQRDTQFVLSESGFERQLKEQNIRFIDLNRDELIPTRLRATYTGLTHLWLPRWKPTLWFQCPRSSKIKTHHWSGATLSMKNMFGVVPGTKYGWPKNLLHWRGIQQSIVDICATVPLHFAIVDGIVAMEGNGPLNGTPRRLNRVVLADDPVAADASCARLMGFEPDRIAHIHETAKFLGNSSTAAIEQLGEPVGAPDAPFEAVPEFEYLRVTRSVAGLS